MGKLLALSLVCTLTSAALFQPALMGEPRRHTAKHRRILIDSASLALELPQKQRHTEVATTYIGSLVPSVAQN